MVGSDIANTIGEADHGKSRLLIRPEHGLETLKTAHAVIEGFEVMRAQQGPGRALRPHRLRLRRGAAPRACLGLRPCALGEVVR